MISGGTIFAWQKCTLLPAFYCIGNCKVTPRRLAKLKKFQRYNRREDGVDFVSMSENFGYHAPATPDGREELIQTV